MNNDNRPKNSSRSFDFKKSKDRRFDFTKDDNSDISKKPKKIIYIIGSIIVLVISVLVVNKCSNNINQEPKNSIIAETEDSIVCNTMSTNKHDSESKIVEHELINKTKTTNIEATTIINESESKKSLNIDFDKTVLSVIRGNYGNNPERRRRLGAEYQEIQDKVNEMYRKGLVH